MAGAVGSGFNEEHYNAIKDLQFGYAEQEKYMEPGDEMTSMSKSRLSSQQFDALRRALGVVGVYTYEGGRKNADGCNYAIIDLPPGEIRARIAQLGKKLENERLQKEQAGSGKPKAHAAGAGDVEQMSEGVKGAGDAPGIRRPLIDFRDKPRVHYSRPEALHEVGAGAIQSPVQPPPPPAAEHAKSGKPLNAEKVKNYLNENSGYWALHDEMGTNFTIREITKEGDTFTLKIDVVVEGGTDKPYGNLTISHGNLENWLLQINDFKKGKQ